MSVSYRVPAVATAAVGALWVPVAVLSVAAPSTLSWFAAGDRWWGWATFPAAHLSPTHLALNAAAASVFAAATWRLYRWWAATVLAAASAGAAAIYTLGAGHPRPVAGFSAALAAMAAAAVFEPSTPRRTRVAAAGVGAALVFTGADASRVVHAVAALLGVTAAATVRFVVDRHRKAVTVVPEGGN